MDHTREAKAFIKRCKVESIDWAVEWMQNAIKRWDECGGWSGLNALDIPYQEIHRLDENDLKQEAIIFLLRFHREYDRLPPDAQLENLMAMVDVMGT